MELLLGKGAVLVPDVEFGSPIHDEVRTVEDYLRFRETTRLFFVLHDSFTVAPLELRSIQREGGQRYYVMQRSGGPTIDFLSTVQFVEEGVDKVNPGYLAFHRTFWDPKAGENRRPPDDLLKLYDELRSLLKTCAKHVKIGTRRYWVGNEMDTALRSGVRSIGIEGI